MTMTDWLDRHGDTWPADPRTTALHDEIASYRQLPLIPLADHRRACDQRDDALALADSLTRELSAARDEVDGARLEQAMACVAKLVRQLERVGGFATSGDQAELWEARALLAEAGQ